MYNVVLIGCGRMGAAHLDDIYLRNDVCIYGVADIIEDRARFFAKKYGAKSFDADYMRYMKDPLVDIMICASYPATHLQILKDCVKYHKHLLCEKPIAGTEKDGLEFIEIAKNAEIKIQIGFILRYNETYKTVAQMIKNNTIGFPLMFRMVQNHHTMDWGKYLALITEASPIIDCGVHYIDVCRWFTGAEFVEIEGISLVTEPDVPEGKYNYGMIAFKLSDGSAGYYEAGWGHTVAAENTKEFIGPKGRIKIIQCDNRFENREEGDLIEIYTAADKQYRMMNINCKRKPAGEELNHLIDMIEKNVPANPSLEDVEESFKVSILADKKINKNRGG